jgi:hypothetical protein
VQIDKLVMLIESPVFTSMSLSTCSVHRAIPRSAMSG